MRRIIPNILFIAGLVLVAVSLYYIFQIVRLNLWEDTIFRIVSVMAFIGGGVFVGLGMVLKNQKTLIDLLKDIKNEKEDELGEKI